MMENKNHLYEDTSGVLHLCDIGEIGGWTKQRLVWTTCEKDVPANMSFKSHEVATCEKCNSAVTTQTKGNTP